MTLNDALQFLAPYQQVNPGRRFAVAYCRPGSAVVAAVAIDRFGGGWDMFAAVYVAPNNSPRWVEYCIPGIQDWHEIPPDHLRSSASSADQAFSALSVESVQSVEKTP